MESMNSSIVEREVDITKIVHVIDTQQEDNKKVYDEYMRLREVSEGRVREVSRDIEEVERDRGRYEEESREVIDGMDRETGEEMERLEGEYGGSIEEREREMDGLEESMESMGREMDVCRERMEALGGGMKERMVERGREIATRERERGEEEEREVERRIQEAEREEGNARERAEVMAGVKNRLEGRLSIEKEKGERMVDALRQVRNEVDRERGVVEKEKAKLEREYERKVREFESGREEVGGLEASVGEAIEALGMLEKYIEERSRRRGEMGILVTTGI